MAKREKGEPAMRYRVPGPPVEDDEEFFDLDDLEEDLDEDLDAITGTSKDGHVKKFNFGREIAAKAAASAAAHVAASTGTHTSIGRTTAPLAQHAPAMIIVLLRCNNVQCRIETFKGGQGLPFVNCPVCQAVGQSISNP